MAFEGADGFHGVSEVEDHDVIAVLLDRRQLINIPFIPGNPQQRLLIRTLINDRTVLQVPEIEVPHRAILATGRKQILIPKTNIENGGIMRNQLRLNAILMNVPNGARGVNGARANYLRRMRIPIKTRNWRTVVRICVSRDFVLDKRVAFLVHLPDSEAFGGGCQDVLAVSFDVGYPHHLSRREVVLKLVDLPEAIIRFVQIKADNVDGVIHRVGIIARHRHMKFIVFPIPKSNGIILKVALIRVNLLGLPVFGLLVDLILELVLDWESSGSGLADALGGTVVLRAGGGCPWEASTTTQTLLHLHLLLRGHALQHVLLVLIPHLPLRPHSRRSRPQHMLLMLLHQHLLLILNIGSNLLGCGAADRAISGPTRARLLLLIRLRSLLLLQRKQHIQMTLIILLLIHINLARVADVLAAILHQLPLITVGSITVCADGRVLLLHTRLLLLIICRITHICGRKKLGLFVCFLLISINSL